MCVRTRLIENVAVIVHFHIYAQQDLMAETETGLQLTGIILNLENQKANN